jgi:prepilin-type N-terminal cleavage/methylation domain-containing protein
MYEAKGLERQSEMKSEHVSGFSLIELLVTISIIAMLAALLTPGCLAARERAKEIQCMSNMRHLHRTLMQYARNHDGNLPSANAQTRDQGSILFNWSYVLASTGYLDSNDYEQKFPLPQDIGYALNGAPSVPPYLYCPSDPAGTVFADFGGGNVHQLGRRQSVKSLERFAGRKTQA